MNVGSCSKVGVGYVANLPLGHGVALGLTTVVLVVIGYVRSRILIVLRGLS